MTQEKRDLGDGSLPGGPGTEAKTLLSNEHAIFNAPLMKIIVKFVTSAYLTKINLLHTRHLFINSYRTFWNSYYTYCAPKHAILDTVQHCTSIFDFTLRNLYVRVVWVAMWNVLATSASCPPCSGHFTSRTSPSTQQISRLFFFCNTAVKQLPQPRRETARRPVSRWRTAAAEPRGQWVQHTKN